MLKGKLYPHSWVSKMKLLTANEVVLGQMKLFLAEQMKCFAIMVAGFPWPFFFVRYRRGRGTKEKSPSIVSGGEVGGEGFTGRWRGKHNLPSTKLRTAFR